MKLRFDEAKATQAAAYFLHLRGGQMHYLKLIKLLYLADREALLRWGSAITTDHYASMEHGPVVSTIYNLIIQEKMPKPVWSEFISAPMGDGYEVKLKKKAPVDRLSRAEEKLMTGIFEKYGNWNRFKLVDDVCHKLPEWVDPGDSSIPLSIADILKSGGQDEDEIQAVHEELSAVASADDIFRRSA